VKKHTLLTLLAALLLAAAFPAAAQETPPTPGELCAAATPATTPDVLAFAAPEDVLADGVDYLAVFCTTAGPILVDLFEEQAPQTVNSFVFLAREGWFDGVTFHRVLPGFVAQTGDPSGTGRGGPGYMIPNEIDSSLSHNEAGVVAMANAGPNTNGSQWYITYGDVSQLDGSYTIFGRVIEGMDVVEAITPRDPSRNPTAPAGDAIAHVTIEEIQP